MKFLCHFETWFLCEFIKESDWRHHKKLLKTFCYWQIGTCSFSVLKRYALLGYYKILFTRGQPFNRMLLEHPYIEYWGTAVQLHMKKINIYILEA